MEGEKEIMKSKFMEDLDNVRFMSGNSTMRHSREAAHIGQQERATVKRRKLNQMAKQSRRRNRS